MSSLKLVTCSDPHTLVAYEGWFGTGVACTTIHSNDYVGGELLAYRSASFVSSFNGLLGSRDKVGQKVQTI